MPALTLTSLMLLLLFVPNFVLAYDIDHAADKGIPTRLTDYQEHVEEDQQPKKKMHQRQLTYTVWDQCEPRPDQKRVKSYGLRFLLPRGYLCPDEGLTVCYPGQLDKKFSQTGIGAAVPFRVKNKKNNNVAQFCEQKRKEFCTRYKCGKEDEDGKLVDVDVMPEWHGLRLYTNNTNGTTFGQREANFVLELSISNTIYKIGVYEELFIEFANLHSPNTVIHANEKRIRFGSDDRLRDAYQHQMERGAFLYKYAGLWMLALDVLPTEAENQLEMFVYRDCQCALEAYFVHPWDEVAPKLPKHIHTAENESECVHDVDEWVHLDLKRSVGAENKKVTIWFWATVNVTTNMEIELFDEKNMEQPILGVNVYRVEKGLLKYGKVDFTVPKNPDGRWHYNSSEDFPKLLKNGTEIRLELTMHPHFIVADYEEMGGAHVMNSFWRQQWWLKRPFEDPPSEIAIHVNGNAGLGQVLVQDTEPKALYTSYPIVGEIEDEIQITIRARVHENANTFSLNLMHDAPEWHEFIGATVLRLEIELLDNGKNNISWKTYENKIWTNSTEQQILPVFVAGKPFECLFVVKRVELGRKDGETIANYSVSVNGELLGHHIGDLPIWTINWIWLDGDVEFLDEPFIFFPELQRDITIYKKALDHLLYYGDVLCIEGFVNETQNAHFSIALMHESSEFSKKIGDTPMRLTFNLAKQFSRSVIKFQKYRHELSTWLACTNCTKQHRVNPPTLFRARITVLDDSYEMVVGEETHSHTFQFAPTFNDGSRVYTPPWATNRVMVTGAIMDVTFGDPERCKGCACGQKPLPTNIDHIYQLLYPGSVVTIGGIVKVKEGMNQSIQIYFFREALELHDIIGSTVLNINLTNVPEADHINATFNTFYNETWKANETHPFSNAIWKPKLEAGAEFELRVEVAKKTFNIHFGHNPVVRYPQFMPYWAVQYIVVQGDLEPKNGAGADEDETEANSFVDIIFR